MLQASAGRVEPRRKPEFAQPCFRPFQLFSLSIFLRDCKSWPLCAVFISLYQKSFYLNATKRIPPLARENATSGTRKCHHCHREPAASENTFATSQVTSTASETKFQMLLSCRFVCRAWNTGLCLQQACRSWLAPVSLPGSAKRRIYWHQNHSGVPVSYTHWFVCVSDALLEKDTFVFAVYIKPRMDWWIDGRTRRPLCQQTSLLQ